MKIHRPLSPLRQRMLEDIQIRNYSLHTIDGYRRYVTQFAKHFHTSPDRLGPEPIRTYQLHLLHTHASESVFIQTVCALRFFYEITLGRPWIVDYIPYPKKPRTLPVILSRDEVKALLLAPRHLKHRAILATLYATGVRVSELCQLQGTDQTWPKHPLHQCGNNRLYSALERPYHRRGRAAHEDAHNLLCRCRLLINHNCA